MTVFSSLHEGINKNWLILYACDFTSVWVTDTAVIMGNLLCFFLAWLQRYTHSDICIVQVPIFYGIYSYFLWTLLFCNFCCFVKFVFASFGFSMSTALTSVAVSEALFYHTLFRSSSCTAGTACLSAFLGVWIVIAWFFSVLTQNGHISFLWLSSFCLSVYFQQNSCIK